MIWGCSAMRIIKVKKVGKNKWRKMSWFETHDDLCCYVLGIAMAILFLIMVF